jgi:hypothetical protein
VARSAAATIPAFAPVAQLAEQRTLNPKVEGSIPSGGTPEGPAQPGFFVSGIIRHLSKVSTMCPNVPRHDDAALVADAFRPARLLDESTLTDRRRTA